MFFKKYFIKYYSAEFIMKTNKKFKDSVCRINNHRVHGVLGVLRPRGGMLYGI